MSQTDHLIEETQHNQSWWFRFIKGAFVGSGFIVPGISGGALAAIFGLYEPIIRFLADMRRNFVKNVLFFIPVGLGALVSVSALSWGISYLLGNFQTIVLWFFVGAILGTVPALWHEAGAHGRRKPDLYIMVGSFVFGLLLLQYGETLFTGSVTANFFVWMLCGALIALGVLVPGLSPSNFIVYMGLYQQMADGFKLLDLSIIIPIGIGGALTVLLLSKLIQYIFDHHYSGFFHFIFGVVLASTIMIVPRPADYAGFTMMNYLMCAVMLIGGVLVGWYMAQLEEKYK